MRCLSNCDRYTARCDVLRTRRSPQDVMSWRTTSVRGDMPCHHTAQKNIEDAPVLLLECPTFETNSTDAPDSDKETPEKDQKAAE